MNEKIVKWTRLFDVPTRMRSGGKSSWENYIKNEPITIYAI